MILLWILLGIILIFFGLVVFHGSPYVPTRKVYIRQALKELYKISPNDVLVDIGSGDGTVLREAAEIGVKKAVGYEINPFLVLISKFLSRKYKNIDVKLADFWLISLPDDTTVIYIFSVTRDIKNITKFIQKESNRLKKSLYVISYGNEINNIELIKKLGAFRLYIFKPLQSHKAQV